MTNKKYQKIIKLQYILIIISLIGIVFTILKPKTIEKADYYEIKNLKSIKIDKSKIIVQTVIPKKNYKYFGLLLSNNNYYKNSKKIIITIEGNNKKKTINYPAKKIIDDNYFYNYYYYKYKFKKNKIYKITISTNSNIDIKLGLTKKNIDNADLSINERKYPGNIAMIFKYNNINYFNIWYFAIFICINLCIIILYNNEVNKDEKK